MIRDTATIVSQKVTVAILDNFSLVLRWLKNSDTVN